MNQSYEKIILEIIDRIKDNQSVEDIYRIYSAELEANEVFYVMSQAQIRIKFPKNKP